MPVNYQHWHLTREPDDLAWLTFDKANATINTFSADVLLELDHILDTLSANPPRGLILHSGKSGGFAAGADVEEFKTVQSVEDALAIVRRGWNTFNKLAQMPFPTLALIRGFAMGGGLEVALACRYRIAVDDPATRLSLPEVMLGILPGWGGVQRLPRLIGPAAALDMLLTGKAIDARRAKKIGLVDRAVPERVQHNAARMLLTSATPPRRLPLKDRIMAGPLRGFVAGRARQQVAARAAPNHYPAPYAIIELWQKYDGDPLATALLAQPQSSASIATLFAHPTTKNLIRVFSLQERLKAFGKGSDFQAQHVHIIGAGTMGGDIAAWCALRGLRVTLQDQSPERLAPAMQRSRDLFERRFRGDKLRQRDALDRLIPDVAGDGVGRADVVIEAIFENLAAKRELVARVEPQLKPGAILATNTSSLALAEIATALKDPTRLVGLHFFNPVAQMMLVEIVQGVRTAQRWTEAGAAFVRAIDKLPLPVRDGPGFLVNRVLGPYMANAFRMIDAGTTAETIDAAAVKFGMPMGPIELADIVGLDICAAAGKSLTSSDQTVPQTVPNCLATLSAAKKLGKKSGVGFYRWERDKAVKSAAAPITDSIINSVMAPYMTAAKQAVADGVVADADLADAGLIFGSGFAPFRGGPLHNG